MDIRKNVVGGGYLDGMSRYHFLYTRWYNMMYRCYSKNSKDYVSYGRKGIEVCDRWKSFRNYVNDVILLPGYEETLVKAGALHLDKDLRKSHGDGYSKDTCVWLSPEINRSLSLRTTQVSQRRFKATRLKDGYVEESINQSRFARRFGLTRSKIGEVLCGKHPHHKGWTFEWIEKSGEIMKIRSDFVTNSSSSSFVIAMKSDASDEDLKKAIPIFAVKELLHIYGENYFEVDIAGWDGATDEEKAIIAQTEIVDSVRYITRKSGLDLGEWLVCPFEASSDTEWLLGAFAYNNGFDDTDMVKTESFQ